MMKNCLRNAALLFFLIMPLLIVNNVYGASNGYSDEFLSSHWMQIDSTTAVDTIKAEDFYKVPGSGVKTEGNNLLLPINGVVEFNVETPKDGRYTIVLEYDIQGTDALKNTATLTWENKEIITGLSMLWKDKIKDYQKDRYGNEMIPGQEVLSGLHYDYIKDYGAINKEPASFELKQGRTKFTLKNNTQPLLLHTVTVFEEKAAPSYKDYKAALGQKEEGSGMIVIEAEDYSIKSDSYIRGGNVQNPVLVPYNSSAKMVNTLVDESWKEAGQKILWEFEVPKAGIYNIGMRYSQNTKQGMTTYRNMEIDGKTPFSELKELAFNYTGLDYDNYTLQDRDGENLGIWLESGKHTIALEVEAAPYEESVNALKKIMTEINDISIDIMKLTGSSKDSNRTWDVKEYLPGIDKTLSGWADQLDAIYTNLGNITGKKPGYAVKLKMASKNLRELAKNPDKIPNRMTKLNEGTGSAAQLIADLMLEISEAPMGMDRLYIYSGQKLPAAHSNPVTKFIEGLKSFVNSFFLKDSFENTSNTSEDQLEVWVTRPIQYVQLLQSLADSDFTSKTGIKVQFSVMPNESKLILANSSNTNPDLAFGISNHVPYDLAARGALTDLTEFDDFLSYISRDYNLESLVPYSIGDGIYGVTETQDFFVLMYRKDILEKLKIPIPQTWDDVKEIMPELQRQSMGFFLPMSGWTGLKPLYTTTPFLFQSGAGLYNSNGMSVSFNDEKGINGFKLMTELFSVYSIEENAPNFFNSFRYGITPIGVTNFSTYTKLMNSAPEIAGLWDMALSPGVKDEKGQILRYQMASDKSDILFSNSKKKEQGWELLKWWLSKDVQIEYADAMQTTFGPEYMWNTANIAAFSQSNFPESHKKVILEQWNWTKELQRHPAGYMVEREISNAWTDVVLNGKNLRTAVDKAALQSNREIRKKLEEFGYIENGKTISDYTMPTVEDIKERVKVGK